jgi:hypothetical protein
MTFCQCGKELRSPERNLCSTAAKFHGVAVEQTWTVRGSYANWTMTITTAAPEDVEQAALEYFPGRAFAHLADQFVDAVNLYESLRDQDVCTCARSRLLAG